MIPEMNSVVEAIPEALSIFVNQIVYDKKSRGERVYTFSLGEAFFDIPRFEVADGAFAAGCHYSSSMGQPELRRKIAGLYGGRYGAPVDWRDEVLVSAGSKPVIYMLMKAVLGEGDEAIIPEPGWLSYKEQVKLAGGVPVSVPYRVGVDGLEGYVTERTKLVVINNPTNPSGRLYSREELEALLGMAVRNGLFVLSDEAYSDFLLPSDEFVSFASVDASREHCLVVNSLSKNMGMSGWRIGYAIAHRDVVRQLLKLNQHLVTCAPTVLQDYLAEHFDEILEATLPQAEAMAEKRREVQAVLDEVGIRALPGVGTFYFLIDVSGFAGTTEQLVYDLLINHNIATVPGRAYGESTGGFIRFGIGVESLGDIRKCLEVIKSFLELEAYDGRAVDAQMERLGISAGDSRD